MDSRNGDADMMRKRIAAFVLAVAICLSFGLAGCGGSGGKGTFDATGYQGKLDDGWSFVYIQLSDDSTMVSLTDDEHQGDDAETYTGVAATDGAGKTTVTDEESGKSISFTLTENEGGNAEVDVEGHGKGTLSAYEGNIFSMVGQMAEDDEASK